MKVEVSLVHRQMQMEGIPISSVPDGDYTVTISFIGYDDYRKSILIENGKKYQIDAILSIEPILMAKLEIISEIDAPYQDLPGAATVMDMQTLKLVNPIGTQEMLEYVPGINGFADDGIGNSRISIGIRGLNPRRSSRVLILKMVFQFSLRFMYIQICIITHLQIGLIR